MKIMERKMRSIKKIMKILNWANYLSLRFQIFGRFKRFSLYDNEKINHQREKNIEMIIILIMKETKKIKIILKIMLMIKIKATKK